MIPFFLISESKMLPHRPITWIQTRAFAQITDSAVDLPSSLKAKSELRLDKIILWQQLGCAPKWWNGLRDSVEVDITKTNRREHRRAVW